MVATMYSRTTSLLVSVLVCTAAFWNVKATPEVPPPATQSHAVTISTDNLPLDTPASTTPSPVLTSSLNSTFNNDSTTVLHSIELSGGTTPPPMKSSEEGSTTMAPTTVHSSVAVPEMGHVSSTVTASTTLHSSVANLETGHLSSTVTASPTVLTSVATSEKGHVKSTVTSSMTSTSSVATSEKGHVSSTVNKSDNTPTVLSTKEPSAPQSNATMTFPVKTNTTFVSDESGNGMKYSETVLTSIFSTILVVVLLTMLAFCFNKYRKRRSQYSHHPLRENVYESEGYSPPDDTLVISGGLYDAPRIYNPNMTVLEEEDSQHDYTSFSSRPGQFRLEFLPGDKDTDPAYNGSLRRNI